MECPNCQQEIKAKDFHNVSLMATCPNCHKRLVFNPSLVPLMLFVVGSYLLYELIPPLSNAIFNFIVGFVIVFVLMVGILRLLLVLKWGKVVEAQVKDKK